MLAVARDITESEFISMTADVQTVDPIEVMKLALRSCDPTSPTSPNRAKFTKIEHENIKCVYEEVPFLSTPLSPKPTATAVEEHEEPYQAAAKAMLSDSKFYMGYSRWDDSLGHYESWVESVKRVMDMHRTKYVHVMTPALAAAIDFAQEAYNKKAILGSQRALQFGGDQIFKHEARLYNCSFSYADRPAFFSGTMYLLLAGCGVGFSVQSHHIAKIPAIKAPDSEQLKNYVIPDSIEGWADSFAVLLSSYFVDGGLFPEFAGKTVHFDVKKIRPRGAFISGGFKAPGPDGLLRSLNMCRMLLDSCVVGLVKGDSVSMRSIQVYDFIMHMADAVLSGGIRRAATICIFSKDDNEMLKAKTGNWYVTNPQRGRSNNSAMLLRDDLKREEWSAIMKSVKEFGEPGFIFASDSEHGYNPCAEIGLRGYTEKGESGFQFCNLVETNGSFCTTRENMFYALKAGAIMGTLQAGYTNFTYLEPSTREITEREALIGVSITGWMSQPAVLFNVDNMRDGAHLVKKVNEEIAALIGIKVAARCTTTKPSGNASVILMTDSGIHGAHAPRYFRNVQMNTHDAVTGLITKTNPKMVEPSAWSQNKTDVVVSFPIISGKSAIFKKDLLGVKQLEYVKLAQQVWIEEGTNLPACVDKTLRHNISNTISVDSWDEVEEYIYQNRYSFAGVSLMAGAGDRAYVQAPFTEVFTAEQLLKMYGTGVLFASGLVVDGNHAFKGNLWTACATVEGFGVDLSVEDSSNLLQRDWVRRAKQFAAAYFENELTPCLNCLKDVFNLHKWEGITRKLKPIVFAAELNQQVYTEVDTMGAVACSGDACEKKW